MPYKLTDKTMKALLAEQQRNPPPKRRKEADGEGHFVSVEPNGSLYFRFKFRFEGVEKEMAFGQYDGTLHGVSLGQSREKHQAAKALLRAGINPIEAKKAAGTAASAAAGAVRPFGKVADEWLDTRPGKGVPGQTPNSKTFARDERMVGYLKDGKETAAGFGKVSMDQVGLSHLSPLLRIVNHPTRIRLQSTARKIIAFAKVHGDWPKDRPSPFADIDFGAGFAPHKEQHRPAITDPVKFGQLLRKIEAFEGRGDNLTGFALELLAYTFVRPGTVQNAEWTHFNLKKAMWVVPFARLKMASERSEAGKSEDDYIVPLSRQAVDLLRELQEVTGDGQYLFPGRAGRTISENTLNFALHAMGYKGIHCAHGFRSSASTMLNRERINGRRRFERELVEMQQDRLDKTTRAVYDRDDRLPERIELMQFWADKVDTMHGGRTKARLRLIA